MLVPNTNMHVAVAIISCIEILLLLVQFIYYLQRPTDKGRLWFLLFLILLIQYNLAGSLLPDARIGIPIHYQYVYTYSTGVAMSIYILYYLYEVFDLTNLRFLTVNGTLYCVILPFILLFVVPYLVTGNFTLFNKLVCVIPTVYGIVVAWLIFKSFFEKYQLLKSDGNKAELIEKMITVFLTYIFWISMPIVTYIEGSQLLEHSLTNFGFLVMAVSYVKSIIVKSHDEYEELKSSQLELKEINEKLKQRVKERTMELERITEERINAFVNIIHETKTPLTLIRNHLEGFSKKYKNTSELTIIIRNINRLSNNITNLFDTERFIKGSEVYNHQQVTNFTQLLQDNLAFFRPTFEAKRIKLIENIGDNIFVQADPNAINSVVNNLLENAIKFTSEDESVHVLLETIEEKDEVLFSVRDSGVGIPKELHKKIFEPYYQINTKKKNSQGMGLGLPIVKKIMDSLNSQILVFSNPEHDKGTSMMSFFRKYTLPDAPIAASKFVVPQNNSLDISGFNIAAKPHNPKKMSILLVEDKHDLVKHLYQRFSVNYNVEYALNGSEALKKLNSLSFVPDIIISDIMMDVMDGFQFIKVLYKMNDFKHIPVIFLSAKTAQMDKLKALRMGVIDFVQKPFSFDELALKIESVLENKKNQEQATHNALLQNLKSKGRFSLPLFENIEEIAIKQCKIFRITEAEFEIAKLVREGLKSPGIAEKIHRAESTINKHIENMFKKTSVNNRSELVKKIWPSPLSN